MLKKLNKRFFISLSIAFALLFVRLVFFLKDGTSDTIETILFWLIFIISLYILFQYTLFLKQKYNVFNRYIDKVIILLYMLVMEILFHLHHFANFSFIYLFSVMLGSIIVIGLSLLLPARVSRVFDFFMMTAFFIYIIGQDIYLTLFEGLFSLRDIVNAKEGADFAGGVYSFSVYHIIYIFVFIFAIISYSKIQKTSHLPFKYGLKKILQVQLLLFILVNLNAVYPVKSARLHTSDHYIYYSNYDKERVAEKFSLVNTLYRDIIQISVPDFSYESNLEYINEFMRDSDKAHVNHEYTKIFEGKNLIFILAESFDELAVSEQLTPNIYNLIGEGINFTNHYVPVYPRTTCDTEIILNTGLIPSINDGPTCYMFNDNSYSNSLANLFNNKGYQTRAFHSNEESFYTRDSLYLGLGYDGFIGRETMGISLTEKRYDSIFAERMLDYYRSEDEPYYSFILTLSGHSPYNLDNLAVEKHFDRVDEYYGDSIPLNIKYYIASQIELDMMIGKLMQDLEDHNDLSDTVIIFMNDHYPYTLNQDDYESIKGVTDVHDKQKGTFFIWSQDIQSSHVDRLTSSFDVLPTIAALFGLDMNYKEYVGLDMFDTSIDPHVYFKDYYVYDSHTYIDMFNTLDDYQLSVYRKSIIYYEYSIAVLKTNYFKYK